MALFHPKTQKEHLTIGIAGTTEGIGVTHLCIALANYMSSKQHKKTACLELSDSTAFTQLKDCPLVHTLPEKISAHRYFQIHDVDYYPKVQMGDIPLLVNSGYEILILDFGALCSDTLGELFRCDRKFLLCSNAPWRKSELASCISTYPQIRQMEFLLFMINYGNRLDMAKFAWDYSISYGQLRTVPFISNPFHIEKEWFSFFEKLLLR